MSVGFAISKFDIDNAAGSVARMISSWSEQSMRLATQLDTIPNPDLVAMGFTEDDVALLRSAVNDMNKLAGIYLGQQEQTPAYDFRTFSKRLTGITLT